MFASKLKMTLPLFLLMSVACSDSTPPSAANYQADNSGKNVRDETQATKTPEDQLENSADLTVVQKIRQELTADDSLSINAKNVKIISTNGSVTLRGPVDSIQEKDLIETKAKIVVGDKSVDNQLEVKTN